MTTSIDLPEAPTVDPTIADPWFYGWRYVKVKQEDGTVVDEQVPLTEEDVLHPLEEDFVGNHDLHQTILNYLKDVFRWRLRDSHGALILSDHRIDWQFPGVRPHGPDIAVFFDSAPWDPIRETYMMRDMGARPIFVIEITSPSTRNKDLTTKVSHYCTVGIPLYIIIDILEVDGLPDIHLMANQTSREGPVLVFNSGINRIWLSGVDLWLAIDGEKVVCLDPKGNPLGDYTEVAVLAAEATQRANDAELRANDAELRASDAELRTQAEKLRAEEAIHRASELESELRRLRGPN